MSEQETTQKPLTIHEAVNFLGMERKAIEGFVQSGELRFDRQDLNKLKEARDNWHSQRKAVKHTRNPS